MSKFRCRCGYVMVFQTGREEYDLALVPNSNIEDVIETFDDRVKYCVKVHQGTLGLQCKSPTTRVRVA